MQNDVLRKRFDKYRRKEIRSRFATLTLIAHPELPTVRASLELLITASGRQEVMIIDQKEADELIGWLACFVETGNLPPDSTV